MYPKQKSYFHFIINYFYNFKTFKLSFKYAKQKSYFHFHINYFYNFKTFELSFKYPKKKSKSIFFIQIIFKILKYLNYPSSILVTFVLCKLFLKF
jgi:hypothetical protein